MKISLNNIGKQYNGEWILKSISFVFLSGSAYWLAGGNGSGKSSLLKIVSGYSLPSIGNISWENGNVELKSEEIAKEIALCSPYQALFDQHSVKQAIAFHFQFKKMQEGISEKEMIELCYLQGNENKLVHQLSSGMQQRLKLTLAICSDTPILLLDEPCSNLDEKGINWYQNTLKKFAANRLIIVASNNKSEEHFLCNEKLDLSAL